MSQRLPLAIPSQMLLQKGTCAGEQINTPRLLRAPGSPSPSCCPTLACSRSGMGMQHVGSSQSCSNRALRAGLVLQELCCMAQHRQSSNAILINEVGLILK